MNCSTRYIIQISMLISMISDINHFVHPNISHQIFMHFTIFCVNLNVQILGGCQY